MTDQKKDDLLRRLIPGPDGQSPVWLYPDGSHRCVTRFDVSDINAALAITRAQPVADDAGGGLAEAVELLRREEKTFAADDSYTHGWNDALDAIVDNNSFNNDLSAECIHGIHPDQCITCTHPAPAEPEAEVDALGHFRTNIDGRSALGCFESAVQAIRNHDKFVVSKDEIKRETWWNIFICECMRLCRDYEHGPEIRAALSTPPARPDKDLIAVRDALELQSFEIRPQLGLPIVVEGGGRFIHERDFISAKSKILAIVNRMIAQTDKTGVV